MSVSIRRDWRHALGVSALATVWMAQLCALAWQLVPEISRWPGWPWAASGGPAALVVGEVVGEGQVWTAGALVWKPVREGTPLLPGQAVRVGRVGEVRVGLPLGATARAAANSLIHVGSAAQFARGYVPLDVVSGLVSVESGERLLRLRLGDVDLALRPATQIFISRNPVSPASRVQVRRGEALVARRDTSTSEPRLETLRAGEVVELSRELGPRRLERKLSTRLNLPREGARIVARSASETVEFAWEGEPAEMLELDQFPDFRAVRQIPASGSFARAELAPGRYYWRVRRDVAVSRSASLAVLPRISVKATSPELGAKVRPKGAKSRVQLVWDAIPDASRYRVELAADEAFQRSLFTVEVDRPSVVVGLPRPGRYFWRVTAIHGSLGEWPAGPAFDFWIRGAVKPKRPVAPAKPEEGAAPPAPKASMRAPALWPAFLTSFLLLRRIWPPGRSASGERRTSRAQRTVKVRLAHSILRSPDQTAISAASRRNLVINAGWRVAVRAIGRALEWLVPRAAAAGPGTVATAHTVLRWGAVNEAKGYRLEVAYDEGFARLVKALEVRQPEAFVPLSAGARYYWRAAALDSDRMRGSYSAVAVLDLRMAPVGRMPASLAVTPGSPLGGPAGIAVGVGPAVIMGTSSGTAALGTASGLGARIDASLLWAWEHQSIELGLSHLSANLRPGSLRAQALHADAILRSPHALVNLPFALGFTYRGLPDLVAGSVGERKLHVFGLLWGPRLELVRGTWGAVLDLWAEAAPIGHVRGAGLRARATVDFPAPAPWLVPEVEAWVRPFWGTGDGSGRRHFFLEAGLRVGLRLRWGP